MLIKIHIARFGSMHLSVTINEFKDRQLNTYLSAASNFWEVTMVVLTITEASTTVKLQDTNHKFYLT